MVPRIRKWTQSGLGHSLAATSNHLFHAKWGHRWKWTFEGLSVWLNCSFASTSSRIKTVPLSFSAWTTSKKPAKPHSLTWTLFCTVLPLLFCLPFFPFISSHFLPYCHSTSSPNFPVSLYHYTEGGCFLTPRSCLQCSLFGQDQLWVVVLCLWAVLMQLKQHDFYHHWMV